MVYMKELGNSFIMDSRERWITSALNSLFLVRESWAKNSVKIKDETLRSGANTPGVYATISKKLIIARKLEEIGISEVEAGYAGMEEHHEFIRQLRKEGSKLIVGVHTRGWVDNFKNEIDDALAAGANVINLLFSTSSILGKALHPNLEGEAVYERIFESVAYAKKKGAIVSIGSADPGDLETFRKTALTAVEAGADRVYIYDGRGWLVPETITFLVKYLRDLIGVKREIAVHFHNDLGLATINTISAIKAGADVVDVTVNGLGHRSGNAPFEQVVMVLEVIYGIRTGINLEKITELCRTVSDLYGIEIPPNWPIVGKNMYTYGGLHISAILEGSWYLWETIRAESIGQKRRLIFGETSLQRDSTSPIAVKMRQMGIKLTQEKIEKVITYLRPLIEEKTSLSEEEVEAAIKELFSDELSNMQINP